MFPPKPKQIPLLMCSRKVRCIESANSKRIITRSIFFKNLFFSILLTLTFALQIHNWKFSYWKIENQAVRTGFKIAYQSTTS
jgi:hypothetical protein